MQGKNKKLAQSVIEYAILLGIVATAITVMSMYVRRAIQANLKTIEDQINIETNESIQPSP